MSGPEPFEIAVSDEVLDDLRERLAATRWPSYPGAGTWEYGADVDYLRELCDHWGREHDWRATERRLNALGSVAWDGLQFFRARPEGAGGVPVLLIHGWPGAPIEFERLMPLLAEAGHEVVAPSLPGYAFSASTDPPLNAAGVSARLLELMQALGHERFAVQGGDWGSVIAAKMAFDAPERVAAVHLNTVGVLPMPSNLEEPPMTGDEIAWAKAGTRWRMGEGFHLLVQAMAPDALAVGLADSPAGLAAWLVDKYRRWSDCDGDVERRFDKDQLCDLLTIYWTTGTIGTSMRLYGAEARDRWRLGPGDRIGVPAAAADFPAEIVRPPREWAERIFSDLRSWTEMARGGHFAAFEEPELLAADVTAFLDGVDA